MTATDPVAFAALGLSKPEARQAYYGFKPVYDYLSGAREHLRTAAALRRVRWERLDVGDPGEDDGTWVRLLPEQTAVSGFANAADALGPFFEDDVGWVVDGEDPRGTRIEVLDADAEREALRLAREPSRPCLTLRPNTTALDRQLRAIARLQAGPPRSLRPLIDLVLPPNGVDWPDPGEDDVDRWFLLTGDDPATTEQRRFVAVALQTPDFAILEGPPGSGKTTVICELILQNLVRGRRVLVCASTHVAVDNVLERIALDDGPAEANVLAVRVGDRAKCSEAVRHLTLDEVIDTERRRIRSHLEPLPHRTLAQDAMLDAAQGGAEMIERLVLDAANVVCGTTIGIQQLPSIKNAGAAVGEPLFDVMILDEASKTTFQEMLVPAVLARRWVLAGDLHQLSPFADAEELGGQLRSYLETSAQLDAKRAEARLAAVRRGHHDGWHREEALTTWSQELAWRLIARFQYRQSNTPPELEAAIDALTPSDRIDDIERVTSVALPSILESLQRGLTGGRASARFPSALLEGLPGPALGCRHVLLTTQQRMHEELAGVVRDRVYRGEAMRTPPEVTKRRRWSYDRYRSRLTWLDTAALLGSGTDGRAVEADRACAELNDFLAWVSIAEEPGPWSVALLSFYRQQASLLRARVRELTDQRDASRRFVVERGGTRVDIDVGTVDSFQGREADLVFLAVGMPRLTHFTRSENRANVAVTRARYQLVIVGARAPIAREADRGHLLACIAAEAPAVTLLPSPRAGGGGRTARRP